MVLDEKVRLRAVQLLAHQKRAELRGLGDVIAKVTQVLRIPTCVACQQRQTQLNVLFPLRGKP